MSRFPRRWKFWKRGYADVSLTEMVFWFVATSLASYKLIPIIRGLIDQRYLVFEIRYWTFMLLYGLVWAFSVSAAGVILIAIVAKLSDLRKIRAVMKSGCRADHKIPR